jgi:hypothetical protein
MTLSLLLDHTQLKNKAQDGGSLRRGHQYLLSMPVESGFWLRHQLLAQDVAYAVVSAAVNPMNGNGSSLCKRRYEARM